jgi:NAD(P)-dependent dehydrogenase (short-subunit alcohol dehydrogenase family)
VVRELGTFIMNMHLIRRAGAGDDIAYLAAYLVSDESSWAAGESFRIDGGVTAGYR